MKLNELVDGQTVKVRLGKPGEEDVNWGSWQDEILYVQRVPITAKKTKARANVCPPGGIATLALKSRPDWAEYSERDYQEQYNLFECEGYYMQIEGLEGVEKVEGAI